MKLKNKIFLSVGAVLVTGVATLMMALSHESPCPPASAAAVGGDTIRTIRHRCYGNPGEVLSLERVARPEPGPHELLIRIRAASVNPYEWHMITGRPYIMRLSTGFGAPASNGMGYDMAGVVVAVGEKVTRFKVGDEVFGGAGNALSDYALAHEDGDVVVKPAEASFEEAAGLLIAGGTALQALRDHGHIAAGQKVLINGASGGVGTYAVQLAKAFGAEVTGVCSTRNVELVRSIGADHVIDYTKENFTESTAQYDLIIDNVGNHGFMALSHVVKPTGTIVMVGGPKTNALFGPLTRVASLKLLQPFLDQRLAFFIADVDASHLELFAGLMRQGKLRSVIDRRYPLEQAGAALDYIGGRHARGKVIITFE